MSAINEERLRKFKEMGLPEPMAPIDPSTVQAPVKNKDFAAKLAALKSGNKRAELNTFIEKAERQAGFVPLEVPAPKHQRVAEGQQRPIDPRKPKTPELKTHAATGPSFDLYERALYGDDRAAVAVQNPNEPDPFSDNYVRASQVVAPSRGYTSDVEDSPVNFFDAIKQKLAEKNSRAAQTQRIQESGNPQRIAAPKQQFDEEQIREYITEISSDVCKKLIKKFMTEYFASEQNIIKESDKVKKAEVVRDDIVKIDGKFFKLQPVQVKKK